MEPFLTIMRKWRLVISAYSFLLGVVAVTQAKKTLRNYMRTQHQNELETKTEQRRVSSLSVSDLILRALMSSMVKEEYSLSSCCSCWAWLRVRRPYMGTDTSWI